MPARARSRTASEKRTKNQKDVFGFLVRHFRSQEAFARRDIEMVTDWQGQSFGTYWSKQFKQFMVPAGADRYRVSEAFRPFASWERFQQHVTQVRHASSDYRKSAYENVLSYEFFMPLTNEGHLRTSLDALFYKDTIKARLRTLDRNELEHWIPRDPDESVDGYLDRVCTHVAAAFIGYSISHVGGRFRAGKISTLEEVAKLQSDGGRYLVDETTAIVRFIFPCQSEIDAATVEWFFRALFIESILQVVNGEDEIWMIESGMRNRLHIWRVENP
jgi:hypothetical protein